jgi:hypothetical protein
MKSVCPTRPTRKKTQAQDGTSESAAVDRRGCRRVDEPFSAVASVLGEVGEQLFVIDLLRLCHYLLAQM